MEEPILVAVDEGSDDRCAVIKYRKELDGTFHIISHEIKKKSHKETTNDH
jgi:hypothetical protein